MIILFHTGNLALLNTTTVKHSRSVVLDNGLILGAERAVDGSLDPVPSNGHCSMSQHRLHNSNSRIWWRADLGYIYAIQEVILFGSKELMCE